MGYIHNLLPYDVNSSSCHRAKFISVGHPIIHMGVIRGAAREAGREVKRRTGCGFLADTINFLGKDIERGMEDHTQEFYKFVMPPMDLYKDGNNIRVVVDLPGFTKEEISINLDGSMLQLTANRKSDNEDAVYAQRPNNITKRIRLPAHIKRREEPDCVASMQDGVLTLTIPVPASGKDIVID